MTKPLVMCTLGDFIEALGMARAAEPEKKPRGDDYGPVLRKGLKGIMDIFGCSRGQAYRILHSGDIDGAVMWLGQRVFVTDPEKAIALYKEAHREYA